MNLTPITAKVRPGHAKALRVDNAQFDIDEDIIVAAALTQFFRNNRADQRRALYSAEARLVDGGEELIGMPAKYVLSVRTMALMTS